MTVRTILGAALVVCAAAAPAAAQTTGARVGGRAFVMGDWQQMTAKDSFEAIADSSTVDGIGGGLELHRVWKRVFLRASVSKMEAVGERIFVFNGTVFPLGQALTLTLTPIELGAGWRFKPVGQRVTPYVGAGALWMKFKEESGGTSADDVNETYSGAVLFGGLDVSVWRAVSAGAEVAWRTAKVKDPGGALEAFGEDNLGGMSFRVMVSIGR